MPIFVAFLSKNCIKWWLIPLLFTSTDMFKKQPGLQSIQKIPNLIYICMQELHISLTNFDEILQKNLIIM